MGSKASPLVLLRCCLSVRVASGMVPPHPRADHWSPAANDIWVLPLADPARCLPGRRRPHPPSGCHTMLVDQRSLRLDTRAHTFY